MPIFPLIQLFYWLALAVWFGGVVFFAIAQPVVFRTVREGDPTLPTVLSVNLEGAHSTLLAGTIMANLLTMLIRVELGCAAVVLVTLAGQWALVGTLQLPLSILRTCLFVAAVVLLIYEWRVVVPRALRHRDEYIDHADEPEIANPARDQFDRYQREAVTVLWLQMAILLGLVLFSTMVSFSTARTFTMQ